MIAIVDSGVGNVGSIQNMFKRIGVESTIVSSPSNLAAAEKIILPGVGAFDHGMKRLIDLGFVESIKRKAGSGTPILGICLGMQMLTNKSAEGDILGLGLVDAEVVRFQFLPEAPALKIPHMGWNSIKIARPHNLFDGMADAPRFYFVHLYHAVCNDQEDVLAMAHYGNDFVAAFQKRNIMGVQFHPEKSHKFGMKLLSNFVGQN